MNITDFSDSGLEAELALRNKEKELRATVPEMLTKENVKDRLWDRLHGGVQEIVDEIVDGVHDSKDRDVTLIWEAVMECFFGDEFFTWYNKQF